jgi:hypothetical protein
MKIVTFNINNINRRLPNLLAWLKAAKPGIVSRRAAYSACSKCSTGDSDMNQFLALERVILYRGHV